MVYPGKPPIIDHFLYPGTYLFVGAPKVGKSFMMAQIAYHVSSGTPMWNYSVRKGTVLYLALEDDYRRLQERLYRMFGTETTPDLFFSVASKSLNEGLLDQLGTFLNEHPETSVVIIDTLQKVREAEGDTYSYARDYDIIAGLKAFADRIVPHRRSRADMIGDLSHHETLADLRRSHEQVSAGVEEVVDDRRFARIDHLIKLRHRNSLH